MTRLTRRAPIKRKARPKAETRRIYGDADRIAWVQSLPCAACGQIGYSQNAHVVPNKAKGKKGHHTGIAPLCGDGCPMRCHSRFDRYEHPFEKGSPERERIQRCAAVVAEMWRNIKGA